ncbi:MAG: ferredoxin [Novosphingobium sp.]|nr:ferredoxin [Novosphingobium sp.]
MKMKIDEELCTDHGRCAHFAPNVFRLDDDRYNADRGGIVEISAGEEKNATMGLKSCPERAISIVEE